MTTTFAVRPHYKYDNIVAELVEIEIDERNPMKQLPNMHLFENKNFNIDINIFEGERSLAKDNHFINRLTLQNLSFSSSNIPLIEIAFDINGFSDGKKFTNTCRNNYNKPNRFTIERGNRLSHSNTQRI